MLLCRVSLITDEKQKLKGNVHPEEWNPARVEIEERMDGIEVNKNDERGEEIDWPQLSEENARLQIPSFKKTDPLVSHGGAAFQRKRLSQELVREKGDPVEHVKKSGKMNFPMGEKAHLPQDILEAIGFISKNEPDTIKAFWESRIEQLKKKAFNCRRATEKWKKSLTNEQKTVQGKINLPLLAHMLNELGMGGQVWVRQFTEGFPVIGEISEPGVYPEQQCADPELKPHQLLTNAKYRLKARMKSVTDPHEGKLWDDAVEQVEKGWLDGPFPFDEEGKMITGEGPQLVNPAFRFGVQQGEKLRAVDDLKRSQTNRAAAIRTPVNLPTWDHFSAVIRTFQEAKMSEGLAMAKADHRDAYKQLPVRKDQECFAIVTLRDPTSGKLRGFIPKTQLFGATAAVLNYNTVSRVMATIAVRWLGMPCMGYFDDFGIITTESTIKEALQAFTTLNQILGFELKVEKSEFGTRIEFLGVTVDFRMIKEECEAQLSLSHERVQKMVHEIKAILQEKEIFLAQMQKLVGKLNFAQTAVMGKVGRVALRPLYDLVMRGGGKLDNRTRWALNWWIRLLPAMSPRIVKPVGSEADVRIYSDACTTGGGMAAIALFSRPAGEFMVQLKGKAEDLLISSLAETNEIFGLELFAMVSAVMALGEQLRGKRMILFLDNNAAAGAMIKASSRVKIILAITECFWQQVAQLGASCWVERVASEANPADAPSRGKSSFRLPDVEGHLESLWGVLQLCCVAFTKEELTKMAW